MKPLFITIAILTSVLFFTGSIQAQNNAKAAIEKLILNYQGALNNSDVDKVMLLYTEDAVFLPNAAPVAVGTEQVKGTYQYVFENLGINLEFSILEIEVTGNKAFARTTSKGSVLVKSSGQTVPDENRELFIFEKVNSEWKIARYMYNKAN